MFDFHKNKLTEKVKKIDKKNPNLYIYINILFHENYFHFLPNKLIMQLADCSYDKLRDFYELT